MNGRECWTLECRKAYDEKIGLYWSCDYKGCCCLPEPKYSDAELIEMQERYIQRYVRTAYRGGNP